MRAVLAFLTRLPMREHDVTRAAKHAHLFPVAGALIGAIVYIIGVISFAHIIPELAALMTLLALYLTTGLIHMDGLADFADALMVQGDRRTKLAALEDVRIGIAGIFAVIFVLISTFYCIKATGANAAPAFVLGYTLPRYRLAIALISSELAAKLSMNTCIAFTEPSHEGIGALFIRHTSKAKYSLAFMLSVFIALGVLSIGHMMLWFIPILVGTLSAFVVVQLANRHLGGINGDALGASNELARVLSLFVWASIL